MTTFKSARTVAAAIGAALVVSSCIIFPVPLGVVTRPTSASCAAVQAFSKTYTVTLTAGDSVAQARINFLGRPTGTFHHNVAMADNGTRYADMDIVSDRCIDNLYGNAVFNLHPAWLNNPETPDLFAGDRWTFSLPAPNGTSIYTVTDTTRSFFANPVAPGWTGQASVP